MEAKTLPADVCVFGRFGQLSLAAVHSADCWFDSGVKWWIHISSIATYLCKNPFFVVLKLLQTMLRIVNALLFLINCGQTLHPLWTQLSHWQMFMQNGEYAAFWYLQVFSRNFNLQLAKTILWSFLVFSETTAEFAWPECSASFVSVQPCFKSAYHV